MVTEFGWPNSNDGTYNRNVINFAESHGWGWTVFAWDGTTTGSFDLLNDAGPTFQAAQAGQPVLAGLTANLAASNLAASTGTASAVKTTHHTGRMPHHLAVRRRTSSAYLHRRLATR